jgi:hypothetical protein
MAEHLDEALLLVVVLLPALPSPALLLYQGGISGRLRALQRAGAYSWSPTKGRGLGPSKILQFFGIRPHYSSIRMDSLIGRLLEIVEVGNSRLYFGL